MKSVIMNLVGGLLPQPAPVCKCQPLAEQLEQARQEWLSALNYYNDVSDADLVDYAAYLIQAAEKKYTYLLKRARQEGIH
ncbi:YaaL family protein [Sporomusa aerivorans]|uniref:YaaL family protein n=1 Tax=Sporomusa aerivorans TaxID=204936 RepID=UPI00352A7AEF